MPEEEDKEIIHKQLNKLANALMLLSKKERECIVFRYYSNKSFEEISNIINLPIDKLNIIHNTAIKKLESELDFLSI